MSNYTLTTDLIADCMALIPHNLEKLNRTQGDFSMRMSLSPENRSPENRVFYEWQSGVDNLFFTECEKYQQFLIISHCLRIIPEFQEIKFLGFPNTIAGGTLHGIAYGEEGRLVIWDTPPSTLKELCESYKNIMSED